MATDAAIVLGIVGRYSRETGIPATPDSFRHAMASTMLNSGAPISLIQDLLGHADRRSWSATKSTTVG